MHWGPIEHLPDRPRIVAHRICDYQPADADWLVLRHPTARVARKLRLGQLWILISIVTGGLMIWGAWTYHSTLTGIVASITITGMVASLYHACVIPWKALALEPRSVFCALAGDWLVQRVGGEFRAIDIRGVHRTELQRQYDGGEGAGLLLTVYWRDPDGIERREAMEHLMAFDPDEVRALARALGGDEAAADPAPDPAPAKAGTVPATT